MKLNDQENSLQPFVMLYGARKTPISVQIAKKRIGPFWTISDYRKKPKRLVLIIGHRKHDSGTRREAFRPMWLTLGDHDQPKSR